MSLQSQIENLAGVTVAKADADAWLTDAAKDLINLLPTSCLYQVSTTITDDGTNGATPPSCRLVAVHKAGRPAREVPASDKAKLTDNGSLHQATELRPAFYRESGKIRIEPGGGTVEVAEFPTINDSDTATSVSGIPDELGPAAIVHAARRALQKEVATVRAGIATDLTLPAVPTAPAAPAISYTNAAAATIASTSIGTLPAPPSYTKVGPTLSFTNLDSWTADEDPEMVEAAAGKLRLQLEEFAQEIQEELSETNTALADYNSEVERIIQQAQIDAQKAAQEAQMATDVDVQNKWRATETALSEYAHELSRFQSQLGAYAQEAGAEMQDFAQRVQRDAQAHNMLLAEIQGLTAQYQEIIQHFISSYS